jgi:hypothetical protein
VPIINSAVSGTVLQNSPMSNGLAQSGNGLDNVVARMLGTNKSEGGIIPYLFNDMRYTGAPSTFNVTAAIACYRKYLNILIEGGYVPSKILIVSPYYITDTGLVTGSTAEFKNQTRANCLLYVAASAQIASEFGTFFVDMYQYMLANGAGGLISPDAIHPSATPGHEVIERGIHTATIINTRAKPALVVTSPSGGTLSWSFPAVASATGYTIEYQLTGSYSGVYTGTVTGTDVSGSFTGLAPGQYIVRAIATFSGGESAWAFTQKVTVAAPAQSGVVFEASFAAAAGTDVTTVTPTVGQKLVAVTSYTPSVFTDGGSPAGCYSTTTNTGVLRTQDAVPGLPYVVEFDLTKLTTISTDNVGIIFHAQSAANTQYFIRYNQPTGGWQAYKNTNSNPAQQGANVAQTFSDGTTLSCKVTVSDAGSGQLNYVLDVGGQTKLSFTDTTPLGFSGLAGIRDAGAKTATTGIHLTKLKVYQPS